MQKYTDSPTREVTSSRHNHIDCASVFCFVKVFGLFYDFLNLFSMAVVGKIPGNIQIPKKILLIYDELMYLTYSVLKAKQFEKLRLESYLSLSTYLVASE